jgi:Spy/CpxP family protein refolding chaperone
MRDRATIRRPSALGLTLAVLAAALATAAADWPGPDWPTATPESQGMSAARGAHGRWILLSQPDQL